ncbi:MAG: excinuclease ABC subunit UvrA, partial [Clostridia bacterium]|nr:excinuclease ABC subunit UvrA [Clostridia bacterium]
MDNAIIVRGAREHNLKNVDITVPRDQLVVFTGLSGSGKSSLAFDTIYAEGQRRYVESMSSYARQFLGQMDKPELDSIEGLSPAISIDQKTTARNPRSTVGTVTEIHDYLRLMYARIGVPHCPECGKEIRQQSIDEMVDAVLSMPEGSKIMIMAPVIRARKGEHIKVLEDARKEGFVRARVNGELVDLDTIEDMPRLDKQKKHFIDIVVDRLVVREGIRQRLSDSMETAMKQAAGLVIVVNASDHTEQLFSQNYACPDCGINIEDLSPRMFSFNSPFGACPHCSGLGTLMKVSEQLVVPDMSKTLNEGAIACMGFNSGEAGSSAHSMFKALAKHYKFSMDKPYGELSEKARQVLMYGTNGEKVKMTFESANGKGVFQTDFEGVITSLERRYRETQSDGMKEAYEAYMATEPCPVCHGQRLRKEALAVTVGDRNLAQLSDMNIRAARAFLQELRLGVSQQMIAQPILREVDARLRFLCDVGLEYLTLSRGAATLSGGEAQRIRLATQIGSGLVGVLYVLDEPSIGLHQRDNARLLGTLKHLRDLGNTLIVVEHDEETLRSADYIVDIGPGAGEHGGHIVAQGTLEDIMNTPGSITGQYLSGQKSIPVPKKRRKPTGFLTVRGAREHNLKNIDVSFPLGVFCCVTGVSGSGKSSLVNSILYGQLSHLLNRARPRRADFDRIEGVEQLDK